jgi:hypothetical protein
LPCCPVTRAAGFLPVSIIEAEIILATHRQSRDLFSSVPRKPEWPSAAQK